MEDPIRYGDEETVTARLSRIGAAWQVILLTLASTPEVENQGLLLAAWRDWLAKHSASTPLLVLIDEGPYAARMRGEAAFEHRLQERRKLWRDFVAGYGLRASFADLMENTPWERYGHGRDPRCEHCLMHCGYEPSAALGVNAKLGDTFKMLLWQLT